ncbi:MAG: tyrosine-protein phosphatase [Myxococcales bacterium]|nr:tyrosine-protein phosphatase [Myxococcales bacterium]
MRRFPPIVAALILASACGGTAQAPDEGDATSADVSTPAIELVSPGVWRGPRPTQATLAQLKSLGVKTILDLEDTPSAIKTERGWAAGLHMTFISEPMSGFWTPDDREVNQIEAIIKDQSRRPIFVHCQHGQDRTGLIVGLYRVFTERWTPAAAYREMLAKGFHKVLFLLNHYYEEKTGFED